ncbi:hypothetical protein FACS189472_17190 [Alphaproteobacteria bacterium]|nr:hypothetical protein FACS189472_17190 [Alphaproteobacteria bacterium]
MHNQGFLGAFSEAISFSSGSDSSCSICCCGRDEKEPLVSVRADEDEEDDDDEDDDDDDDDNADEGVELIPKNEARKSAGPCAGVGGDGVRDRVGEEARETTQETEGEAQEGEEESDLKYFCLNFFSLPILGRGLLSFSLSFPFPSFPGPAV